MKALIIYWHPEPQSFNAAMFNTARKVLADGENEVQVSDLYASDFNPVSSRDNYATIKDPGYFKQQIEEMHASESNGFSPVVLREIEKLEWCELLILQFPLWWFGLPATLKGWVDRVFAMGRIYGGGKIYKTGVFSGKKAMLSMTTGGPEDAYQKNGFNGDINGILRPIHRGILEFIGFDVLKPHIVYAPVRMTDEERQQQLSDYAHRLKHINSETPIDVGIY